MSLIEQTTLCWRCKSRPQLNPTVGMCAECNDIKNEACLKFLMPNPKPATTPPVYQPSYEELKKMIEQAPKTWLPALFHCVVTRCLEKNVFQPKAMARFCREEEEKHL